MEKSFVPKTQLFNKDNPQFNFADGIETVTGGENWDSQLGYFGRINYAYADKYLFEGNLRYDATSISLHTCAGSGILLSLPVGYSPKSSLWKVFVRC